MIYCCTNLAKLPRVRMEAGKMDNQWYTLTSKKDFGTTTGAYEINLKVPLFHRLLKTHAMTRSFQTKSSIIQVPDTPFRLKLAFIGRRNELMEIYYLSKYNILLKSQLNLKLGGFCETFLTRNYSKVIANRWRYVSRIKDPLFKTDASNDVLCLHFIFKVCLKSEPIEMPTPQLSNDFQVLLTEGTYSDATLKSINGENFKVHKNILSIRSCVLKAHFDHVLAESGTNTLETDFETEVLRDVLIYLYTDTAPRVDREPEKLISAADFYQIQGLKNICEKALYKKLNVENAIEILQLAELYNAKTLKQQTLDFIKYEGAEGIIKTEGWKKNTSAELVKKIYDYIIMMDDMSMDVLADANREV